MTNEEVDGLFMVAANHCLIYGIGMIKLVNTPTGMVVEVIHPNEYLQMSEALKWAAENTFRVDQ